MVKNTEVKDGDILTIDLAERRGRTAAIAFRMLETSIFPSYHPDRPNDRGICNLAPPSPCPQRRAHPAAPS
jgi:hypothetical protein